MREWTVRYPIAGSVTVVVRAEDRELAIEAGWDLVGDKDAELEWEAMDSITRGNVCYAPYNSISASDEGEVDDDD